MKCKRCGAEMPDAKRTCSECGAFLEGYTLNNVTGEYGYRGADGNFYKSEEDYHTKSSAAAQPAIAQAAKAPKYKKGAHVWAKRPKELAGRTGYVRAVDTYRMVYEVTFGTERWELLEDDLELVDPATEEARQTVFECEDDADQPLTEQAAYDEYQERSKTSGDRAEKTKKTRKAREQFYKAYEWFRYPDVVHVKKDGMHSDVVCFKEFGSAYMEVTDKPGEDTEIYVKLPSFVKYATRKIGLRIDRLIDDMNQMGMDFPHDYMPLSDSSRIEALHTAIGILICLQSEIEKDGLSKLKED